MKETEIEKYLIKEVEKRGGFVRKYTSPGRRGVPDRIVFLPGKVIFVECKTLEGKLSGLQRREIKRMQDLKIPVFVANHKIGIDHLMGLFDRAYNSISDDPRTRH